MVETIKYDLWLRTVHVKLQGSSLNRNNIKVTSSNIFCSPIFQYQLQKLFVMEAFKWKIPLICSRDR